jgi:hypothetical protein
MGSNCSGTIIPEQTTILEQTTGSSCSGIIPEQTTGSSYSGTKISGVRFEPSSRVTIRLTSMRAVFKYRYAGRLTNNFK